MLLTAPDPRALLLLLVAVLALAGCASAPPPSKRSFMVSAEGIRTPTDVPVGLNPLGSLQTCRSAPEGARAPSRVLVSRPEHFTQDASLMISDLREALAGRGEALPPLEFVLAPQRIESAEQARELGRLCGALIVLWEPGESKTLELTLPQPAQVPLRDLVQQRLCDYGDHSEQIRILYLTIAGLVSLRDNEYDKAVLYMETARTLDDHCLHLPGPKAAPAPGAKQ